MRRATGLSLLLGPPAIWGSLVVVGWGALQSLNPLLLTLVTWLVAALALLLLSAGRLASLLGSLRRHFLWYVVVGLAGTTGFQFLWYSGLAVADPVDVALLTATLPVFICIGDRLIFGAELSGLRVAGLAVAVIGAAYLAAAGQWANIAKLQFSAGAGAILGANVAMTVYTLGLRFRVPQAGPLELLTLIAVGGVIGFTPLCLVLDLGGPIPGTAGIWVSILYIGLVAYAGAYLLWNLSVIRNGPSLTGIALYTQPVFALIFAWLFLGTGLEAHQLAAGFAILAGLGLAEWGSHRREPSARSVSAERNPPTTATKERET